MYISSTAVRIFDLQNEQRLIILLTRLKMLNYNTLIIKLYCNATKIMLKSKKFHHTTDLKSGFMFRL